MQLKNKRLLKRMTAFKAVHIFEYMEYNNFYRHNEAMEAFKNEFVAEIDKRLAKKQAELKVLPVVENNLIKVDAETFHYVFSLNYIKIWRENYVSLYPLSTYKKHQEFISTNRFNGWFCGSR